MILSDHALVCIAHYIVHHVSMILKSWCVLCVVCCVVCWVLCVVYEVFSLSCLIISDPLWSFMNIFIVLCVVCYVVYVFLIRSAPFWWSLIRYDPLWSCSSTHRSIYWASLWYAFERVCCVVCCVVCCLLCGVRCVFFHIHPDHLWFFLIRYASFCSCYNMYRSHYVSSCCLLCVQCCVLCVVCCVRFWSFVILSDPLFFFIHISDHTLLNIARFS